MTQPEFTLDWPYGWQTRDGRGVEIYRTDAPGPCPIHGRIDGIWRSISWDENGKNQYLNDDIGLHLVNRPAPVVSVPVDKLHDGSMFYLPELRQIIIAPIAPNLKGCTSRNIKYFYIDEMESVK